MTPFYIFDLEVYPNCFLFSGKFQGAFCVDTFEISPRKNQRDELLSHLSYLKNCNAIMVGYNNIGYDYTILHELLANPYTFTFEKARQINNEIFTRQEYGFTNLYWKERIIPQLDLMKLNHFDNVARRTRLKDLQFAMRIQSVEDLPFDPNKDLTSEQMDRLISYNIHDIVATEEFLNKNSEQIKMRQELINDRVIFGDVLNYSDVKIGVEYLVKSIGREKCYISAGKPRQTFREMISFKEIILPKIYFRTDLYTKVYDWFTQQKVYPNGNRPVPSLETRLAGIDFKFGIGGVHASVENKVFHSNETHVIRDVDVSGMYVAVAIANGFYPEHLGQAFVDSYRQLQSDRKKYPKGTTMNALLKLAGNGVYGKSNDLYSCFYDPKYTFSVTVNGQLQLLQLVELLSLIPGVQIIQANTDGITAYVDRKVDSFFQMWCQAWEEMTSLKLEHVEYKSMWIRDVNNYMAQTSDGKMKRKGAYWYPEKDTDYDGVWNKDFSTMVVQKAVEKCLVYNYTPEKVVPLFTNKFDYMLRHKTTGSSKTILGDKLMQKTLRYYVSTHGEVLKRVDNPKGELGGFKRKNGITDEFYARTLASIPKGTWDERIHTKNKSTYTIRENRIEKGRLVKECNNADNFDWNDVDYDYYIQEVKKLIVGA